MVFRRYTSPSAFGKKENIRKSVAGETVECGKYKYVFEGHSNIVKNLSTNNESSWRIIAGPSRAFLNLFHFRSVWKMCKQLFYLAVFLCFRCCYFLSEKKNIDKRARSVTPYFCTDHYQWLTMFECYSYLLFYSVRVKSIFRAFYCWIFG